MERQGVVVTAVVCPRTEHDRWPWEWSGVLTGVDQELVVFRQWGWCLYIHCNFAITKFVIGVFPLGYICPWAKCKQKPSDRPGSTHTIRARKVLRANIDCLISSVDHMPCALGSDAPGRPFIAAPRGPPARPWPPWHFIATRRCKPPGLQWRWYGM